jgi:hypothetical protein
MPGCSEPGRKQNDMNDINPNDLGRKPGRQRLNNRRASETFTFELDGLRFTASVSRFSDGRIGELFLNNHKSGNQSDTNARDAAIALSFALQHGADLDDIRKALCRDARGNAIGPLGRALDLIAGQDRQS